jgi:hypothetical protein
VTDAVVTLHMSSTGSTPVDIELHRLLSDWGEGASNAGSGGGAGAPAAAGDATWLHTFFPGTFWNAAGGDFAAGVSATQSVAGAGFYSWTGAGLIADVQDWVVTPGANHGWLLMGGEGTPGSAKRFDSHENTSAGFRPELTVTYTIPAPGGAGVVMGGLALAGRRRRGAIRR